MPRTRTLERNHQIAWRATHAEHLNGTLPTSIISPFSHTCSIAPTSPPHPHHPHHSLQTAQTRSPLIALTPHPLPSNPPSLISALIPAPNPSAHALTAFTRPLGPSTVSKTHKPSPLRARPHVLRILHPPIPSLPIIGPLLAYSARALAGTYREAMYDPGRKGPRLRCKNWESVERSMQSAKRKNALAEVTPSR